MNRGILQRSAGFVALGLAWIAPATAGADTVQVGSALTATYTQAASCGPACVVVQTAVPVATPSLTSPVNGAVTSWAVRSGDVTSRYVLRVLRPAGGLSYTGAGTAVAPTEIPAATDTVYSYPATPPLPIKKGDAVGLNNPTPGTSSYGAPTHLYFPPPDPSYKMQFSNGVLDGATAEFGGNEPQELLLQATVSFCNLPGLKLKGKKLAKAKKAIARAPDCGGGVKAKKKRLKPTRKNLKKKNKVLKQPTETVAPGTPVELTVGTLKK